MQLSIYEDNIDAYRRFRELSEDNLIHVFLNGEEVQHVEEVDDEAGYIVQCVLDLEGNLLLNPDKPDEIWTKKLFGKVEIRLVSTVVNK